MGIYLKYWEDSVIIANLIKRVIAFNKSISKYYWRYRYWSADNIRLNNIINAKNR